MARQPPKLAGPVRMREVAQLAQVSAMTVSRALRFPDSVSDDALQRVSQAIAQLGYIPNQLAGSLKTFNRTKVMGVIVPNVRNAIFADSLKGLSDELRNHGFSIMLADGSYSGKLEEELIAAFLAQKPRAMVLHETEHTAPARILLQKSGIPIVEIGNLTRKPVDMVVSFSNYLAAKAMTEHLLGRGYRRIAFVSLPMTVTRAAERLRGYKAALRAAGAHLDPQIIRQVPGGYASGAQVMASLLLARPRIDAVFFAGDVLAVGGLLECQRRGVAVPGQVAVAGFDDLEIASQTTPRLTTLHIPRYEIGQEAARLILARLHRKTGAEGNSVDVGFSVVPRDST